MKNLFFTGRPPEVELMFANRMKIPHTFVIHTYTKPTQCQFCKKMLVGVFKQVLIIPPSFLIVKCALCSKGYTIDAVGSSGILKGKQKLGVTFNSDKLGGIDFTNFSKLSMCSAGAGRYWLVLVKVYV